MRDFLEMSRRYLFAPICVAMMGVAHAQDATLPSGTTTTSGTTSSAGTTATTPATNGGSKFVSSVVTSFSGFAGSEANAESLALGLRQGTSVTLSSTGSNGQSGTATFTPPTRPMGWGNVRHALSLAQAQLAAQGITQPTPGQLEAALMGGTITTGSGATAQTIEYQGVLQLRAQGMGWGEIVHAIGVKPGGSTLNAGTGSSAGRQQTGMVTASGAPVERRAEFRQEVRERGQGIEHRAAHRVEFRGAATVGQGIVTAAGTPAGAMIMHGKAHVQGSAVNAAVSGGSGGRAGGNSSSGHGRGGRD